MLYDYIFYTLRILKLNRIKNILLYDLSTNLDSRVKKCDIKMKYVILRPCDVYIKISTLFLINTNCL